MESIQDRQHSAFVVKEIHEITEAFAEDMERNPTAMELFAVLWWGLQSASHDMLADLHPGNVISLKMQIKKDGKKALHDIDLQSVSDLNDNTFVVAGDFLSSLSNIMKADLGAAPTWKQFSDTLISGLNQCDDHLLSDINPAHIAGIKARISKRSKTISKPGDIVAIPAANGKYFIACVLVKNRIGTAYGLFKGTSKIKPVSISSHPEPEPYPVYSGNLFVENGRWRIIGHDPGLLSLFPSDPEIFHAPQKISSGVKIGPYGAAEAISSGQLRQLSKTEAEAIGLLNGQYRQTYLEEYLEQRLNQKLRA